MPRRFMISLAIVGMFNVAVFAERPTATSNAIEKLMSPADFRGAGLHKLSKAELAALNLWLSTHMFRGATDVALDDVIESRIEGDFNGWDGDTIFRLTNGQIWQQASVSVFVAVRVQPKVTIYRSEGGYLMKVEGIERTLRVRRLR